MLPFGLLGLAWWRRGRIGRRDIILSGGFFLLSAVMAGMTVLVQNRHMGVLTKPLDGIYRLAGAGWVMWFYIYKTLLPVKMSMIYPHWKETIESLGWISFLPTAALAGIFAVLFLKRRTRWARPVLFAFGYFVLAVFPVLGFFNMSFMMHSLVADHFQYLPIIGVISLVCAACWMLAQNRKPQTRAIMGTVAAGVLVLLGMQTFRRANVLKDELSLWRNTVEVNGEAWMAQYNLGNMISRPTDTMFEQINASRKKSTELSGRAKALRDTGNLKQARIYDQLALKHKNQAEAEYQKAKSILFQAESHYRKSIEIQPMHAWSYNNLGVSLLKLERIDEAIEQYHKGIEMDRLSLIRKRTPILPYNLGNALLKKERFEEAADAFKQSYLTHYTYENALNKALSTYRRLGKYNECIELLNAHLKRHPEDPGAHQSLSKYLIETGKVDQAVKHIKQSIDLAPTNPLPHMTEGEILVKANRPAEAVESFRQAIRFNRQKHMLRDDNLQIKLAEALSLAGRNADALATLALVLRSNPNHGHARESLRNLMKQLGHTPQAAECYEETLKVIPDWIDGLQKLAWIRATHPDPNVRDASQALGLVKNLSSRINNDPIVLDTFAAALAENKQFPQAVSAAKKALKIARDEKNEDLARQIEDRLGLYEKGRPYRENR